MNTVRQRSYENRDMLVSIAQYFSVSNALPLTLIAGPCQLESREHALFMADSIAKVALKLKINFVFKTSFDKANRSSIDGARGIGIEKATRIFDDIHRNIGCPIITDIHETAQIAEIEDHVDILQIPALLCRQTDLLISAGKSQKTVNIKKGQFLSPYDIQNIVDKVLSTHNSNILLTERGTSFGYNTLVNDMRGLEIMKDTGFPVIFDATHSIQQPGILGKSSGGERRFIKTLSRAATAVGIAGIFLETHNDPTSAPCDGPCMLPLQELEALLVEIMQIDAVIKNY